MRKLSTKIVGKYPLFMDLSTLSTEVHMENLWNTSLLITKNVEKWRIVHFIFGLYTIYT